jgi:DNA modification methylase
MEAPVSRAIHTLRRGEIHVARAEDVYPDIQPGSVSLLLSDGPYFLRKAAWDKFKSWAGFVDWYRPHIEAWGRVCAPSATVYVWGSDESEGYLRQPIREAGWTFRGSITWDRVRSYAQVGYARLSGFPDVSESCSVWMRGTPTFEGGHAMTNVWRLAPDAFQTERLASGARNHRVRHQASDWAESLHPCQKPLAFYERMIRASSRPGDLVLEPFGGTCRAAVAIERLPAAEARRYVVIEPDEDGRDYIAAVLRSLTFDPGDERDGQPSLFGGAS